MSNEATGIIKAALYARVSTDDQRERQTIDNQVNALRGFAPHSGITIVDEYLDDGVSGTVPLHKRPEGGRLVQDARDGRFDVVVFYKLDRLARSLRNFWISRFFNAYRSSARGALASAPAASSLSPIPTDRAAVSLPERAPNRGTPGARVPVRLGFFVARDRGHLRGITLNDVAHRATRHTEKLRDPARTDTSVV